MSWLDNPWLIGPACALAGILAGYWLFRRNQRQLQAAQAWQRKSVLDQAQLQAETVVRNARLQAEEESLQLREALERKFAAHHQEIAQTEMRLTEREALINRQLENVVAEEQALRDQQRDWQQKHQLLQTRQAELDQLKATRLAELQKLAGLSEAEARALFMKEAELGALQDASTLTRHILDDARGRAEEKARRIIAVAVQRYAAPHTYEIASATVTLPNEELKGRIIGREGRNIRAFESATGVTVLIDDTPNGVTLSTFDPVRREIARESMERLLVDGRIHPSRIEEIVAEVSREMETTMVRMGEEAVASVGLATVHPDLVRLLGQLRFRHSFSQNVLQHSVEVAHLAALMAAEMGLNTEVARRAGLFHDIGKAINHDVAGAHALIGADYLRRCGESEEVVRAVASHHDEAPHFGPVGILVSAADAISASRPGARSETMTVYIKRVEDLERIGLSFEGVEKCFAVQAGRELRVFVQPGRIDDSQAHLLARDISRRIENELQYPGQIRVTVVRETRCIEFAK